MLVECVQSKLIFNVVHFILLLYIIFDKKISILDHHLSTSVSVSSISASDTFALKLRGKRRKTLALCVSPFSTFTLRAICF